MAQYPVPQFIEAEGKIISFLTFRQFFILVGGGAVCFFLYYTLPFYFFAVSSVIIGLFAMAIAFLKINDTSIVTIFLNFLSFSTKSKNYTWEKKDVLHPIIMKRNHAIKGVQQKTTALESEASKLKNLTKILELRKK
jgi:hypothetical protein